jgi:protein-tyrosine kinase
MTNEITDSSNEKSIGNIIAEAHNLSPQQVDQVLKHQRQTGTKFGEAAVELGLVKREDVLWALSQQFHYPYAAEGRKSVSTELVVATSPFDAAAEFFRDIRSQLISAVFDASDSQLALAVCSPDVGDGKSFFAANLAAAFSQLGGRTLLIDADMRRPRQHEIFRLDSGRSGLSSVLSGRAETNVLRPIDALPSLYLLPVGVIPPNPLELVQRPTFDLLLNELSNKFDYIIVDTPAAAHGADARVVAAKCGAAVAIGRKNVTDIKAMRALVDQLEKACTTFCGTVFNTYG